MLSRYFVRVVLVILIAANALLWNRSRESANSIEASAQFLLGLEEQMSVANPPPVRHSRIRTTLETMTVIEKEAKNASLDRLLDRIDDRGENGVRITFNRVGFDALLRWLAQLQSDNGLYPDRISIVAQQEPGTVSARLDFATQRRP